MTTPPDPSHYYTPTRILRLIEPQAGSGLFLADLLTSPPFDADAAPSVADPIRLGGDGDMPRPGNGSATEGVGSWAPRPDDLVCAIGDRAGVPVAGARPVTGAVA